MAGQRAPRTLRRSSARPRESTPTTTESRIAFIETDRSGPRRPCTFRPTGPTRSAAQWWQINTASGSVGVVQQLGARDDPSGAFDYAYPTLDVNANDDMMIGYSRFGASQYASANYSFRRHSDAPNTLEADTVFKAGEAPYTKDFGTGDVRWGDYSNTAVDPINDIDMWTIQEYAGAGNTWGTWWGTIALSETVATPTPSPTPTARPTPTATRTPTPKPTPTAHPSPGEHQRRHAHQSRGGHRGRPQGTPPQR